MSISTGSTFDAISVSDVRELMLPSTQNEEQERISRFLNRVIFKTDTLISKKQRLIELLKEKRAAIIARAVTKGLNPSAPMKDSGVEWIGEMPKHWNIGLIKQGYQVTLGKMLQPNKRSENDFEAPYLRSANIQDGFVDTSEIKTMYFNKSEDHLLLEEGDLLVCEGGDVGRAAIWSNQVSNCRFQNSINRIRSKTNSVRYLFYLLKASKRSGFIDFLCNRATISHFTAEKVKGLRIVYPDMTEQLKIANYLDKETSRMNSFISKIETSIELLKEYRSALITAAVTGKIDVREEVP
jgi:type I restriction enzyme S subunit